MTDHRVYACKASTGQQGAGDPDREAHLPFCTPQAEARATLPQGRVYLLSSFFLVSPRSSIHRSIIPYIPGSYHIYIPTCVSHYVTHHRFIIALSSPISHASIVHPSSPLWRRILPLTHTARRHIMCHCTLHLAWHKRRPPKPNRRGTPSSVHITPYQIYHGAETL